MTTLLDTSETFEWEEDLPRPRWERIADRIDTGVDAEGQHAAWSDAARQWLTALRNSLGSGYQVEESPRFVLLAPQPEPPADALIAFAAHCRDSICEILPGVADFREPGKQTLIILRDQEDYYRYVSVFYPEGRSGGSAGMHIREGYPHIVLCGPTLGVIEATLAHEMTHAALAHLSLPQWVEEGLAQMMEGDVAGRPRPLLEGRTARQHKRVWGNRGLDEFWYGEGFFLPGRLQDLSYQLAEVLVRILIEEHRPRWFGWDRTPQHRLIAFLTSARATDAGSAAALEHLRFGLEELAGRFLGPGDWAPSLRAESVGDDDPPSPGVSSALTPRSPRTPSLRSPAARQKGHEM